MSKHSTTAIHPITTPDVRYFPASKDRPEFVVLTVQHATVQHSSFSAGVVTLSMTASESAQGQMYLSAQQARELADAIYAALPQPVALELAS